MIKIKSMSIYGNFKKDSYPDNTYWELIQSCLQSEENMMPLWRPRGIYKYQTILGTQMQT